LEKDDICTYIRLVIQNMKALATIAVTAAAYTFSTDELAQEEKRLTLGKAVEVTGLTVPV